MTHAGQLRDRVSFQQRSLDVNGDRRGAWVEEFTRPARIVALRGTEVVLQQRLAGVQPSVVTVRADAATRGVTNAWRIVPDTGAPLNIRAVTPDERRVWLDILGDTGPSTGGA